MGMSTEHTTESIDNIQAAILERAPLIYKLYYIRMYIPS